MSAYGEALRSTTTDTDELSKLTKNLTESQKANVLANKNLTQTETGAIVAKTASASATGLATFSMQAYTTALLANAKAMLLAIATNPATYILGIAAAVGVAIYAYKKWNPTIEEQKDKLSELNNEYENTVQELKTLGDEIEKNTNRIDELLAKDRDGTITLIEEDELKKLALANKLLAEQEDAKEDDEKSQATELLEANRKTFAQEYGASTSTDVATVDAIHPLHSLSMIGSDDITNKNLIYSINALYEEIDNAVASGDKEAEKSLNAGLDNLLGILSGRAGSMITGILKYQETLIKFMNPDGTFDDDINKQNWDQAEAWKKEIYALNNSSGEWNTIQINTALSDTSLTDVQSEIQEKLANGDTLTEEDIAKYDGLIAALNDANLILEDGQSVASVYLQYLNGIAISQRTVNQSIPDFSFNVDNTEEIDNYQSDLNTLSGAMDKIRNNNLSDSELLDLYQAFPTLTGETDNLSNAIQTLIDDKLKVLKSALQDTGASDEILDLFNNITAESSNISLDEMLSELQSTHTVLDELEAEVNETGRISVETLQNIGSNYSELEDDIDSYLEGKSDEKDLIGELTKEYETDLQNYKLYMAQKKGEDEEFYDLILDNLSDDLINKAKEYGIELGNYSNYLEAKLVMDKEYASKKAQLEITNNHLEQMEENYKGGMPATLASFKTVETKNRLEKEILDIEKIIEGIDASIDVVIPDFRTDVPFTKPGSDSGSDEEEEKFSEEYDWIAKAVENAERSVAEFDEKLSNTNGFQKRIDVLDGLKVANQNLVDVTKKASEKYEDIWMEKAANIPDKYQDYITGDQSKYTVQTFGNEETYNNVIAAANAYDIWQESVSKYNDALKKQKEDENTENAILLEKEELKLEIHNLDNQETMTVTERLKWLEREKELKASILKYNLLNATSEKERLRLQAEYDGYIEDTVDDEYEIKKNKRSNKISFYDSRIQDFQNQIDYAESRGGQGTEEQYSSINEYLERQKDVYRIDRDEAMAKRDSYKYGTDKYKQYNDELQEAQDNIYACTTAQLENNKAILLLPVKKLEDDNKALQKKLDTLTEYRSKVESAIGYANTLIQEQIDILSESKESVSDFWDDQIKDIQEQKDLLTETNDEIQRQIDLENAKYNLEKAMRNKTTRIYRAGEGFVYEADNKAVMEAQQELDQQEFDNIIANFDKSIDSFTKQKEDAIEIIDNQIKAWTEYGSQIDKVTSSYEKFISMQDFFSVFGTDALNKVMSMDTGVLTTFQTTLNNAKFETDAIQAKIDANNLTIQAIKDEADEYLLKAGELQISQEKIKKAITENEEELLAIEERTAKSKELSETWMGTNSQLASALGYITTSHTTARDSESTILDERKKTLEGFRDSAIGIYGEISTAVDKANNAFDSLKTILNNARSTYQEIIDLHIKSGGKGMSSATITFPEYHSGGIVNSSNKLPEHLIELTESNLKPNETLAKLLNGEVVLNNNQMGNMFSNLSRAYSAITPTNKRENSSMEITIGDVNVYNPDNSDMIVNEIVKELPLKVIQKLHSK